MSRLQALVAGLCAVLSLVAGPSARAADPLPSWNDGAVKKAIVSFVSEVTKEGGKSWVPPSERIATFDNDGTLWVEQPIYTQLVFAVDRVKELAPEHPEWKTRQPFQAVLAGDMKTALASGQKGLVEMVMATHAGMTADQFTGIVSDWLAKNQHPRFKHLYTDCVYQPQLELLQYLRNNGFKTFIVSGGGIEFMRPWTERVYGIPPEQVVGSSIVTEFQMRDGKPVGFYQHIGRRPILAFGNSDSDMQMIQYTQGGKGPRLGLFLHHTDAEREYAYDRESHVGTLDEVLDMAKAQGWILVDTKRDWKVVFPFDD